VIDINGYYTRTSLTELHTRLAAAEAKIVTSEAKIGVLESGQPSSVTGEESGVVGLTTLPTASVSVAVTAPVAGHVALHSAASVRHSADDRDVTCGIFETGSMPTVNILNRRRGFSGLRGSMSATMVHCQGRER
jgi:hypothetical protein